MIEVWADVGGTFTDCFVVHPGQQRRARKVLSSGAVKGTVAAGSHGSRIIDPARRGDPPRFWIGFSLRLLDDCGQPLRQATVVDFDSRHGHLTLAPPLADEAATGQAYELISELEAPVLATRWLLGLPLDQPLPPLDVRLGTTRGTNALLTRCGAATALVATAGFGDLLRIGQQDRPDLFALDIRKPPPLTDCVVEIDERLDAEGRVLRSADEAAVERQLRAVHGKGIQSLAVCLLHAYKNDVHERLVQRVAQGVGFDQLSLSSDVAPLIQLVARAETTTLDAYLNPILSHYLNRVWRQFGGRDAVRLRVMTSGGVLAGGDAFRGRDSILSGPAGGVVGLAAVARAARLTDGAIGLDMGGTSTDVSRYDGQPRRQYESRKAGVRVLTPMMAIETVAAGGGSICWVDGRRLLVGPQSAGAEPGPACYGRGGPLTVTDLNLLLGRLVESRFPFALDRDAARERLRQLRQQLADGGAVFACDEALAEGFWRIAVNHMAEAVRTVSMSDGADPRPMTLVGFGGAAGQHLTAVAADLAMRRVLDHPDASMLSALGIGLASVGRSSAAGVYRPLDELAADPRQLDAVRNQLQRQTLADLQAELRGDALVQDRWTAELRYLQTDAPLEVPLDPVETLEYRFRQAHRRAFGYDRPQRRVELVALRVEMTAGDGELSDVLTLANESASPNDRPEVPPATQALFADGRWGTAGRFDRQLLTAGCRVEGPALIASDNSTLVVDAGWTATAAADGSFVAERGADATIGGDAGLQCESTPNVPATLGADAVLVEVIARRLQGIADAMGEVLRRTAVSVNVKQRRDYSCAVFRGDGSLVANAPHVPVHLGAMGHTVRRIIEQFPHMTSGDCYLSNDPYAGGSHLPDVTVVTPVFVEGERHTLALGDRQPAFFVASRAHHAEIGGLTPGSMPPAATRLAEEGVVIRDFALLRHGQSYEERLASLLADGPYPSRSPAENLADIAAQQAAGMRGASELAALATAMGADVLDRSMQRLQDLAAEAVQRMIARLPTGPRRFCDGLDDGTPVCVTVTALPDIGRLRVDFTGTGPVHPRGFNATPSIVTAAVMYVLRCLTDRPLPLNEGVMRRVDLVIPAGLLNPSAAAEPGDSPAVVAGNVETSQRVVDVLLGALQAAAASQGTMNNLLIGDATFGYYETICGGAGATVHAPGADAVHTHMTNTRITDPEVLESRYPVRLWRFAIRHGSGGAGRHRGGHGAVREIQFLRPLTVSLLTQRRGHNRPFGMAGGESGAAGHNRLLRGAVDSQSGESVEPTSEEALPACTTIEVAAGDTLVIETPGGGGWGTPPTG